MDSNPGITLKFYNLIRNVTGTGTLVVSLDAPVTLSSLLAFLVARYGQGFKGLIFSETGALNPHVRIFLNNEPIREESLSWEVAPGAEVSFFWAISGG